MVEQHDCISGTNVQFCMIVFIIPFVFCLLGSFTRHRDQTHAAKVPKEQNWLIIERENLVQGDTYQVWIEAQSAPGIAISNMLILHLDDIG